MDFKINLNARVVVPHNFGLLQIFYITICFSTTYKNHRKDEQIFFCQKKKNIDTRERGENICEDIFKNLKL